VTVTTHYTLLGVDPAAPPDEIKRAFRREVARYHPDKVQHLGQEFQAIATERAASLTEAYRVLMNAELRAQYDAQLASRTPAAPSTAHVGGDQWVPPPRDPSPASAAAGPPAAEKPAASGTGALPLVRRAVLARLAEAAAASSGIAAPAKGFDAAYQLKGRRGLFTRAEPDVRVAAQIVPQVDGAAVEAAWQAATRLAAGPDTTCLLMLGTGVSAAGELSAAISDLRRKTRGTSPLVIPVDIRDWHALVPPDTPSPVRGMLDRLRGA